MPSPDSDTPPEGDAQKWIVEARGGSREALGRLLEMCRHYLLLVANQELAPGLHAKVAPSDVVQDSLLEAGRDYPRFQGGTEAELLGWLRRILRNNVANVHRRYEAAKREVEREVALDNGKADALLGDAVKQSETPSKQLQAREQDELLERGMRQLSEQQRQVLQLHTFDGLTFVQIAELWNSTADAVRKQWGRAVEELAKHLETPHDAFGCHQ
jgi:RNA polymerase sigma-70 factor (ECF subfamily)